MYNELNKQMELGLNSSTMVCQAKQRPRRLPQAGWWFGQIRKMIDSEEVHPVSRPIQTRFEFPSRHKVCNSA